MSHSNIQIFHECQTNQPPPKKVKGTDLLNANVGLNILCQVSGHKNANGLNYYIRASNLVQIITDDFGCLVCERRGVIYGQKRQSTTMSHRQIVAKRMCQDRNVR